MLLRKLLLCSLIFAMQPSYAVVRSDSSSPSTPTPTPQTNLLPAQPNKPAAQATTITVQQTTPASPSGQPNLEAIITNQSSNITPEQAKMLAEQAKNLSPEQMQSIAAALQTAQPQPALTSETVTVVKETTPPPPPTTLSPQEIRRQDAFNALMDDVLPLSPDQILKLHKYYDITQQAKASTPNPPPNPMFTSIVVNLEPGSQPPVIRLSAGFVTSILFVDSTGAAWPITAYSVGDPQNFNIQWDQKGNALFIQSMKQYSHGNLAIRLWGLDTPVMLTLVSGQKNVDFRVDLQVRGRGPDAKPATIDTTANAKVNPLLINILDGIPPRDSIKLGVSGGEGEAWLADNRIFFRTKLTVLSPAWTAKVASADGTHVYELMLTPSILASHNGRTIDIKLSGL